MTKILTLIDVKKMLEEDDIRYYVISYEYGFLLHYKNLAGINIKYYFNQEGRYMYPTPENIATLGKELLNS